MILRGKYNITVVSQKASPDATATPNHNLSVIYGVLRIRKIEHDGRVRLGAAAVRELAREVYAPVEAQRPIVEDVDVQGLVVGRGVDQADLARLHEVVRHHDVPLVRRDLDVVRPDRGLVLVRVVEPLHVVQVRDVESRDVVRGRQGEVGKLSIRRNIGAMVVSSQLRR